MYASDWRWARAMVVNGGRLDSFSVLSKYLEIHCLPPVRSGIRGLNLLQHDNQQRGDGAEDDAQEKPDQPAAMLRLG